MSFQLRPYPQDLAQRGCEILQRLGLVYFAAEVRVGKTHMALKCAELYGAKSVLFLTKKKVLTTEDKKNGVQVGSIEGDYKAGGYQFAITIINNESFHKIDGKYDLVVLDEAHRLAQFPKPSKGTQQIAAKYGRLPLIYLSGTPTPESLNQIYHQMYVSSRSPFRQYANFYQWFSAMGCVKCMFKNGAYDRPDYKNNEPIINKYFDEQRRLITKADPLREAKIQTLELDRADAIKRARLANERIRAAIEPYFIRKTQAEAGFVTSVQEHILEVEMKPITYQIAKKLRKDRVFQGKTEVILGDTPVKLKTKLHQIFSGTIKFESGNSMILDDSKAVFIKERFAGKKIGIFYKFIEEYNLLKQVFGDDLCNDLAEFNNSTKNIAYQIVSGREGISLKAADYLVYINIDYSNVSFIQSKDRMTTMDRPSNEVFWIFSKNGIEHAIYRAVKEDKGVFTDMHFKQYIKNGF